MGILKKCKQCNADYQAKTERSDYCSTNCKQASYRNKNNPVTVTPVTQPVTVTSTVTQPPEASNGKYNIEYLPGGQHYDGIVRGGVITKTTKPVKDMTRQELSTAINAYPQDTWIDSPEHQELMRRLRTLTIDELKAQGYWIPAWKLKGAA